MGGGTYRYNIHFDMGTSTKTKQSTRRSLSQAELEAFQLLGELPSKATAESIRASFRKKAREMHPDRGGKGGDMDKLTKAKETALAWIAVKS